MRSASNIKSHLDSGLGRITCLSFRLWARAPSADGEGEDIVDPTKRRHNCLPPSWRHYLRVTNVQDTGVLFLFRGVCRILLSTVNEERWFCELGTTTTRIEPPSRLDWWKKHHRCHFNTIVTYQFLNYHLHWTFSSSFDFSLLDISLRQDFRHYYGGTKHAHQHYITRYQPSFCNHCRAYFYACVAGRTCVYFCRNFYVLVPHTCQPIQFQREGIMARMDVLSNYPYAWFYHSVDLSFHADTDTCVSTNGRYFLHFPDTSLHGSWGLSLLLYDGRSNPTLSIVEIYAQSRPKRYSISP